LYRSYKNSFAGFSSLSVTLHYINGHSAKSTKQGDYALPCSQYRPTVSSSAHRLKVTVKSYVKMCVFCEMTDVIQLV